MRRKGAVHAQAVDLRFHRRDRRAVVHIRDAHIHAAERIAVHGRIRPDRKRAVPGEFLRDLAVHGAAPHQDRDRFQIRKHRRRAVPPPDDRINAEAVAVLHHGEAELLLPVASIDVDDPQLRLKAFRALDRNRLVIQKQRIIFVVFALLRGQLDPLVYTVAIQIILVCFSCGNCDRLHRHGWLGRRLRHGRGFHHGRRLARLRIRRGRRLHRRAPCRRIDREGFSVPEHRQKPLRDHDDEHDGQHRAAGAQAERQRQPIVLLPHRLFRRVRIRGARQLRLRGLRLRSGRFLRRRNRRAGRCSRRVLLRRHRLFVRSRLRHRRLLRLHTGRQALSLRPAAVHAERRAFRNFLSAMDAKHLNPTILIRTQSAGRTRRRPCPYYSIFFLQNQCAGKQTPHGSKRAVRDLLGILNHRERWRTLQFCSLTIR